MDDYIGEIKMFAGTFAPLNWLFCEGQTLPINGEYSSLFNLIGTTFGGDGINNFQLPNLSGRIVLGAGTGPGLTPRIPGAIGGTENVTLQQSQMPQHSHMVKCDTTTLGRDLANTPNNNLPAILSTGQAYGANETGNPVMKQDMLSMYGSSQPHDNMPPWGCIHYIICYSGIWPPQA